MISKLPSVTVYTGTLNPSTQMFKEMLESVRMQNYGNIREHLVMDGGSKKESIELAKKYGCKVFVIPELRVKEQERFCLGMLKAKGDLILILESDNILTSTDWLDKMVQPFIDNNKIYCTYSAYNTYEKNMSNMTKYTALFGSPDPVVYYLRKSDKIPLTVKRYDKGDIINETNEYYTVRFDKKNLPVMGDNGHLVKAKVLRSVIDKTENFIHVDAYSELLLKGYNTVGVVKNSIIHLTNPSLSSMVRRRIDVKKKFYDQKRKSRSYLVYNPSSTQDRINLMKFIFASLTIIYPLYESIRGYMTIRERAWFLHPVICMAMLLAYGISEISFRFQKK